MDNGYIIDINSYKTLNLMFNVFVFMFIECCLKLSLTL